MDDKYLSLIDIEKLPHTLQYLISCIGLKNTFMMTSLYGGQQKYIPKKTSKTSLSLIIPEVDLKKLIEEFSGTYLEIPKNDHFIRQIRNIKIQEDINLGLSRSSIAKKYSLSTRQVNNIHKGLISNP